MADLSGLSEAEWLEVVDMDALARRPRRRCMCDACIIARQETLSERVFPNPLDPPEASPHIDRPQKIVGHYRCACGCGDTTLRGAPLEKLLAEVAFRIGGFER